MSRIINWIERHFRRAWREAAKRGICDALGSAEYQRVLEAWRAAGRPEDVVRFITWRANCPPALFPPEESLE